MTTEDLIRMAREAHLRILKSTKAPQAIEKFAELVALTKEQQMVANGWRLCAVKQRPEQMCEIAEQIRLEEREACAKVCEEEARVWREERSESAAVALLCAFRIRARGA